MQISKEAQNLDTQLKTLRSTQGICLCGFLIAVYVVLSLFNLPITEVVEIRFGFLVFIAAGMIGGPVMGFTVGFLADIVNCLIRGFAYFPGFSFSYGLLGAISGLMFPCKPQPRRPVRSGGIYNQPDPEHALAPHHVRI